MWISAMRHESVFIRHERRQWIDRKKSKQKYIQFFIYIYTFLFYIFIVILRIYYEYIILINDYIVVFIIMIL